MCQGVPLGTEPVGLGRARKKRSKSKPGPRRQPVAELGGEVVALTPEVIESSERVGRLHLEQGARASFSRSASRDPARSSSGLASSRVSVTRSRRRSTSAWSASRSERVASGSLVEANSAQVPLKEVFEMLLALDGTHLGLGEPVLDGL